MTSIASPSRSALCDRVVRELREPSLLTNWGSNLYGFPTETSDIDLRGFFVAPTAEIVGLFGIDRKVSTPSGTEFDVILWEIGEFIKLALNGSPVVHEVLGAPRPLRADGAGIAVLGARPVFLSQKCRDGFIGAALSNLRLAQQLHERLCLGGDASERPERERRFKKAIRHTFRLLDHGEDLIRTGTFTPVVDKPDVLAEKTELPIEDVTRQAFRQIDLIKKTRTRLPVAPDWEAANDVLLHVRRLWYA